MAEVLSQSQIDALLNSLHENAGNEDKGPKKEEKKFRKYDFYSPKKFTKDKLRILQDVFDKYSRITATKISSLLRIGCETELMTIEEQRYYEFSNALSDDDVLTVVNVELPDQAKNKPVLMHISPALMVNFIDRMLGGEDVSNDTDTSYVYTDIELVCYESIIKHFIAGLSETWASYLGLKFSFGQIAINPGMFQAIGMDETVVIATVSENLGGKVSGVLSICFSGNLLSDIFQILDKKINREKEEGLDYEDSSDVIMNYLRNSELNVNAKMGDVQLNLSDIYNLQVGDIINLNKPKDSEIEIQVEGIPCFNGILGQYKKNLSVLLTTRQVTNDEELVQQLSEERTPSS